MSVRYIGSKVRVADAIIEHAGDPAGGGRFVDAFCGAGAVASAAAARGWRVHANDSMPSAVAMTTGALVGSLDVPFAGVGGYERAAAHLNAAAGESGFLHQQYSPASAALVGHERRYFTEANAARLDAMRGIIGAWSASGAITRVEEQLLLAGLMQAANRVANISGTYGAYLSQWTAGALRPISFVARELPHRATDFTTSVGDVLDVEVGPDDVVYFDPPYTKRQYAAYYHVLETLAAGDHPDVGGVTGLRPWKDKASDYSYKTRALGALSRLMARTQARKILLSYSSEGFVSQDDLLEAIDHLGAVTVHTLKSVGRYRPNARASAAAGSVVEYLVELVPTAAASPASEVSIGASRELLPA